MTSTASFALTALIAATIPAAAFAMPVDQIAAGDGSAFSLTAGAATVTATQTGDTASLLGGERSVTLVRDGGFAGNISAEKAADSDVIAVRNDTVAAGTLTLGYSAFDDLDLVSGFDRLTVNIDRLFQSTGIGDGEVTIGVTFFSGVDMDTVFAPRLEASLNPGAQGVDFLFSDYSGIDFSAIDAIDVIFDSNIIGTDFDIQSILLGAIDGPQNDVPAPAGLGLLGLGLLGVAAARRRRNA
ncbi:MAG: PEP-CTERM sorting domain-containing protein [Pacificimonas sp.]